MFFCTKPFRGWGHLPRRGAVYGFLAIGTAWIGAGCSDDDAVQTPLPGDSAVFFSASSVMMSEMTRILDIEIVRTGSLADSVDVQLGFTPGTAESSVDFVGGTRHATFQPEADAATLSILVFADSTAETDETFTVEISSTTPEVPIDEPRSVEVTITDLATDFHLPDVNPNSASQGTMVSPRDEMQRISAWYFGHAT